MNKLQTILNDEIDRRTEINRSGMKINWDERSDLPSQFVGTKMTETRSDAYGYNARSELTNAVKNATLNEYAYWYDDIGNRETSVEPDNAFAYTANNLNQYMQIAEDDDTFTPTYDLDGNQTLVKTKTGIWSVTYNGENRPVLWTCGTTNLVMKFDRMGRRVEYVEAVGSVTNKHQKFVYDGYLCIQRLNGTNNSITELFEWDPTEPVATRPMFMQYRVPGQTYALFYTHDGNKNVSEVVHYSRANGVAAHYEYAPFGEVTAQVRQGGITAYDFAAINPWRFSSEYADDASATVYYNYRHYESVTGRWMSRDPIVDVELYDDVLCPYCYINNGVIGGFDSCGLKIGPGDYGILPGAKRPPKTPTVKGGVGIALNLLLSRLSDLMLNCDGPCVKAENCMSCCNLATAAAMAAATSAYLADASCCSSWGWGFPVCLVAVGAIYDATLDAILENQEKCLSSCQDNSP